MVADCLSVPSIPPDRVTAPLRSAFCVPLADQLSSVDDGWWASTAWYQVCIEAGWLTLTRRVDAGWTGVLIDFQG